MSSLRITQPLRAERSGDPRSMARKIQTCLVAITLCALPGATWAQDTKAISVELNSTVQVEDSCQLTFMLHNQLAQDATSLVLETVLLTKDGAVNRLSLFDMRDLPAGGRRVRQFSVPELACDDLAQVLINGIAECNLGEAAECGDVLKLSTRTDVEMLG